MDIMKRAVFALIILAHLLAEASCYKAYDSSQKRCDVRLGIETGWVCGRVRYADNGACYASFTGIPYAKPPVGKNRFMAPQRLCKWKPNFMLDATEEPPSCPQTDQSFGRMASTVNGMSEDCLYLSLHVPCRYLPRFRLPQYHRGLPIVVVITGVDFQSGSGDTGVLGPQYMCMRNVIVITLSYRLNVFGFFSLYNKYIPGNQGLRDILACLRWVQRNACSFGGDPDNVTVLGHSAGATAAHILSMSNASKGLFNRLILMSGTAMTYTTSPKYMADVGQMFLHQLGINETDPVHIHDQLVKMPLLKLMHANTAMQFNGLLFGITEERVIPGVETILSKDPITLLAEGWGREYPALISYTNNEMASQRWTIVEKNVIPNVKYDRIALVPPRLVYSLAEDDIKVIEERIDERYFKKRYTLNNMVRYFTDMRYKHPALKVAEWRAATGAAPTYMYQLAYDFAFSVVKAAHWVDYQGSGHMDDLACLFRVNNLLKDHNTHFPPRNPDDAMKLWMVNLVTNFMTFGQPIPSGDALWPPVAADKIQYNLITAPMQVEMTGMTRQEEDMVAFFDSLDRDSRTYSTTSSQQKTEVIEDEDTSDLRSRTYSTTSSQQKTEVIEDEDTSDPESRTYSTTSSQQKTEVIEDEDTSDPESRTYSRTTSLQKTEVIEDEDTSDLRSRYTSTPPDDE